MSATLQPRAVRVVAVVPARGGSRGVPGKNLAHVGSRRLIERAVDAGVAAGEIDLVVVSTDSADIADVARAAGAEVVQRPADLSGDTATSESAVFHALDTLRDRGIEPEVTVLVQCTSPFLDPADLDAAVKQVRDDGLDTCFAAVASHAFVWRAQGDGTVRGVNHDDTVQRRRRQDLEPDLHETGAFYAVRTESLRRSGNRFAGRTGVQLVRAATAVEIDLPEDLDVARALAPVVEARPGAHVGAPANEGARP